MRPNEVLEINTTLPNINSETTSESVHSPNSPVSQINYTPHAVSTKKNGTTAKRVASLLNSLSAYPDSRLTNSSQTLHHYTDDSSSLYSPRSLDGMAIKPSHSLDRMNSFSTTDSRQTRVRLVGRGGSGSKPRTVQTEPSTSPISGMRLKPVSTSLSAPQLDSKRRFVGRGGSGSKQRTIKGKEVQRDAEGLASSGSPSGEGLARGEPDTIVRLPGRGGAGSRPRVVADGVVKGNSGLKLLWPRGKTTNKLSGHPTTSPGHARQVSTESSASTSTTQTLTPGPSLPNPVTTADLDINLDMSSPMQKPLTPVHDCKPGNINKIARTMGELPPHMIYQQLLNKKHPTSLPKLDTDSSISISSSIAPNPPSGGSRNSKSQRKSLSLPHHLGPVSESPSTSSSLRFSGTDQRRESLAPSQRTASTCGTLSDLHRFGLADDLSESWGEIRDDSYNNSPSSESPITFSPPTPIVERPSQSSILSYRDSVTSSSAFPATVNHAVMSDTDSLAGVSISTSRSSLSLASSHGPRPALSLSLGREEYSEVEQDASEEGEVTTPVNMMPGASSTACVSESPLPHPSGSTFAATAVSEVFSQHGGNVKPHEEPPSSHSHRLKPSLTSLCSVASSGLYSTRPDTPFGEYSVPHPSYTPPASQRRWSITTGPYDNGKDFVVIASSRTSTTSVSDSQGWSGEWNTKLPDVIQALRLL